MITCHVQQVRPHRGHPVVPGQCRVGLRLVNLRSPSRAPSTMAIATIRFSITIGPRFGGSLAMHRGASANYESAWTLERSLMILSV
jgi:hypothetical protein